MKDTTTGTVAPAAYRFKEDQEKLSHGFPPNVTFGGNLKPVLFLHDYWEQNKFLEIGGQDTRIFFNFFLAIRATWAKKIDFQNREVRQKPTQNPDFFGTRIDLEMVSMVVTEGYRISCDEF